MAPLNAAGRESGHFHAVRFYEDSESLARMVATFVAEGLIGGEPAIIIGTTEHCDAILKKLEAMALNIDQLKLQGDLLMLDAHETLAAFMVNGMPNSDRFEEAMIPIIDKVCRGRTAVIRAYGEMVDVLWKDGKEAAAVRLEMLWNQLANTRQFSLLCGYSMGSFYKDAAFEDIYKQHTHVVSIDGVAAAVKVSRVN